MVFPLVQLVILGYAMGGNVKHLKVAVVDQDRGLPAVRVRELAGAVAGGANTFETVQYADQGAALADLRNGRTSRSSRTTRTTSCRRRSWGRWAASCPRSTSPLPRRACPP